MSSYLLDTDTFGTVSDVTTELVEWEEVNFSTYNEDEREAAMNAMGLPFFRQYCAEADARDKEVMRELEKEMDVNDRMREALGESRKPFVVYTDGEVGERLIKSCTTGVGLHWDEKGREYLTPDEFKVGVAELEDMNSDGDPHATYACLIHAGAISPEYTKTLELNDHMQSFGEDWLSPVSSNRSELPELAASYEVAVMASKWKVTCEQAGQIRDRLLGAKFNYLLFDKEKTIRTWLLARDGDVEGLLIWLDLMVEQMSELDPEEHLIPEAQMGVDMSDQDKTLATYMTYDKEEVAAFHGLTEAQWSDAGIDRFMNEWRTSYKDDSPSEHGDKPVLETIFGTINGKRVTARKLINRVRECTSHKEMGMLAKNMIDAKIEGYVAFNWFWGVYHTHSLAIEFKANPRAEQAVNAVVEAGGNAVKKMTLVTHNKEQVLMILQDTNIMSLPEVRKFAKSLRDLGHYHHVVVLPPNKGGGTVVGAALDGMQKIEMEHDVESSFKCCTHTAFGYDGVGQDFSLAMFYTIRKPNVRDINLVLFRNSKGAYVLYETN